MSYLEQCLEKFNKLPVAFKSKVGSLEAFEKIEAMEEEFGIDLKFLVVLVAIREVTLKDIPEYVQTKYQLAEEDAFEIRDWLIKEIFKLTPDFPLAKSVPGKASEDVNIFLNSKDEVIKIFHSGLASILKNQTSENNKFLNQINEAVFFWLSKDGLFQNSLVKSFVNNEEILTTNRLNFEGQEITPTIAHWLKVFINRVGADTCNELIIAQYLSDSPDIKKLSIEEKNFVRKLIRVYYNLAFFPDSLKDITLENWEIIPTNKIKNDEIKKELKVPSPAVSKKIASPAVTQAKIISSELAVKNTEMNSADENLLQELELAIQNYSEQTLEYKVLNQEIKRLKKKK